MIALFAFSCFLLFSSRHIREQGSSAKRHDKIEFVGGTRIFHFEDTMTLYLSDRY